MTRRKGAITCLVKPGSKVGVCIYLESIRQHAFPPETCPPASREHRGGRPRGGDPVRGCPRYSGRFRIVCKCSYLNMRSQTANIRVPYLSDWVKKVAVRVGSAEAAHPLI